MMVCEIYKKNKEIAIAWYCEKANSKVTPELCKHICKFLNLNDYSNCPKCGSDTIMYHKYGIDNGSWLCPDCGHNWR